MAKIIKNNKNEDMAAEKSKKAVVKKSSSKKANSKQNNANKMLSKIPFLNCYKECGIIESTHHRFTVSYKININDGVQDRPIDELKAGLSGILSKVSGKFSYQIYIQNSTINIDNFLDTVHLPENKTDAINSCIRSYNAMLDNNAEIGHNNFERSVIFVLSYEADMVDQAVDMFEKVNKSLIEQFHNVYGYTIERQSIEDRLKTIYGIFHPDAKHNYDAAYKKKGTIKGAIAPNTYEQVSIDCMKVGLLYTRTLFINSVPSVVSHTLLNDLMSTSSNSILSIVCQPIDAELGYEVAQRKVLENTESKRVSIRNTVEDRKYKRSKVVKQKIQETEEQFFYEQAEKVLGKVVEEKDTMNMTTMLITLFAQSEEELDRDTKLLALSASKFAVQIRACEQFQDEAFQSVCPVCNVKVDTSRFIPASTVASLQPFRTRSTSSNKYSFCGLNSISDNFILVDRSLCDIGLISGVEHSGKTFGVKREALMKLMNSDEEVLILSNRISDYKEFTEKLGGEIFESNHINFYNLTNNEFMRKSILETFMTFEAGLHQKHFAVAKKNSILEQIHREAESLAKFDNWAAAIQNVNSNRNSYPAFIGAMRKYQGIKNVPDFIRTTNRLNVIEVKEDVDMLFMLMSALNYIKLMESKGKIVNLFVDNIDQFFYTADGSDFLNHFINEMKKLQSSVIFVVQSTVRILADMDAQIEYGFFVEKINFFKLLGQGPIERKFYIEKLNIPSSLHQYMSDREPGEGVIITPGENVAFNDRFEHQSDPFYGLFYKTEEED